MKRFVHSLPTAIATLGLILVLGCHRTDRTEPPEEDPSPVTKLEIPPQWHLDQIISLYRDRARLTSDDGASYAASWRMTLDEAQAMVTGLLDAHLLAFCMERLQEDGDAFPEDPDEARKYVAGIVAGHTDITLQAVYGDIQRVTVGLPPRPPAESVGEGDDYGDCPGSVELITPKTNHACKKSNEQASIDELWRINRVAAFCATARGYHTASTDEPPPAYGDSHSFYGV